MTQNIQNKKILQNKKIIFSIVGILSFQMLILISIYGENWSIEVAGPSTGAGLPVMYSYFTEDKYDYEVLLQEQDSHIHLTSRIPLLLSLFFNDFDTKSLMYLGWAMLTASIFFIYSILKRQDEKLIWLLIPISALIFNPIQYFTVLWSFAFFCYGIPFVATVVITHLLNKKNVKNRSYFISILVGVIASFSIVGGPLALVSGIIPLAYKKDFKKLVGWISVIIVVATAYIFSWSGKITERFLINPETQIINFLKAVSLPFTVKFDINYSILGIILITIFIMSLIFLKKSKKIDASIPWIQMSTVGILISLMVSLGKGNVTYYYSTMSDLFVIGLVGLFGIIILQLGLKSDKKKIRIVLILLMIGMLILLIPSYYMGWKLADDFNTYESKRNSCYSLNPDNEECKFNYKILSKLDTKEQMQVMNELLKQKMGIFSSDKLNETAEKDLNEFNQNLEDNKKIGNGFGEILEINGKNENRIENLSDPIITISGWMENDMHQTVDYIYIISNKTPLTKISDFGESPIDYESSENGNDSFWEITILSGYLEEKCSNISIIGFKNDEKVFLNDEVIICKT